MATVATRRASLLTALQTISGLRCHDTFPDSVYLPSAIIWGPLSRTLDTEDGDVTRTWEILLLVTSTQQERQRGQKAIDPYLEESGSKSIIAAIESADGQMLVTGWSDYGAIQVGEEQTYYGVKFSLTELA